MILFIFNFFMILIVFKSIKSDRKNFETTLLFLQKNISTDVFNNYAQRINLFKCGDKNMFLPQISGSYDNLATLGYKKHYGTVRDKNHSTIVYAKGVYIYWIAVFFLF